VKLLALLAVTTLAGGVATDDLRYTRMVEGAGGSHVAVEPDAPMFAHARPGFADVRVVDARGEQVPWRTRPADVPVFDEPVLVLNSGRQGRFAVALLDLGAGAGGSGGRARAIRDRVVLDVPDRDFVGRVVVLGAFRPEGPFTRLGATGIYDVAGAERARSTTAVFAPTIYRFLLVRATGVTRITGATAAKGPEAPYKVDRNPQVATRHAGRRTVVTLDFGYRNVPVDELRISAGTRRYDRPVVVEATNDRFGRNWAPVTAGRISRFPGAVPSPIPVGTRARYVRVKIDNGDDPALERIDVRALSRSFALVLEGRHPAPYTLYYGAPGARRPNYEFARIPLRPSDAVVGGSLTPERVNPDFDVPERPFGERHGWILPAALALGAGVVGAAGFLAMRRRA
jgi:hypothetical protein